jgi:hypothetical protein
VLNKNDTTSFLPGDLVEVKLTGEQALILAKLAPEPKDSNIGDKYLIRLLNHSTRQVFACELVPQQ